jgi:ribonuclease D
VNSLNKKTTMQRPHHPSKEEIINLAPMNRLGLADIVLINTLDQAELALQTLLTHDVLGFDTESKPTFIKEEVSSGPHIVQFATLQKAYIFQLHDAASTRIASQILTNQKIQKVGFGLAGDHVQIKRTLGVHPHNVLDLNEVFRNQGYIKELGVKSAVAVMFQQRFLKSKKATTSNWANQSLTESQLVYAANDAWAAIKVFHALNV